MIHNIYYGMIAAHVVCNIYEYWSMARTTYRAVKITYDGTNYIATTAVGYITADAGYTDAGSDYELTEWVIEN
jgi:hypothetical protein